jgi:hypothetical protein
MTRPVEGSRVEQYHIRPTPDGWRVDCHGCDWNANLTHPADGPRVTISDAWRAVDAHFTQAHRQTAHRQTGDTRP